MADGDAASAMGLPLVPDSGENGRVRWGAREINKTRDMVANLRNRTTIGSYDPDNAMGQDGDIYLKIV